MRQKVHPPYQWEEQVNIWWSTVDHQTRGLEEKNPDIDFKTRKLYRVGYFDEDMINLICERSELFSRQNFDQTLLRALYL